MSRSPLEYGLAGGSKYGRYYRHSGQLRVGGVLASLLAGVPAGVVMAVAYAAAVIFIPSVKLAGLACIAFAFGLGGVPAVIMRALRVRNTAVAMAVIGVVAIAAYYASWVAWETIRYRDTQGLRSMVALSLRPDLVVATAWRLYPVGTWALGSSSSSSGDNRVSGMTLGLIWLSEAATIFAVSLGFGRAMIGSKPYCEKCDRWCDGPITIRTMAAADPAALRQRLEAGHFEDVAALGPADPAQYLTLARHTCLACKELNTLTISSHKIVRDKKGRVRQNARKVFVNKLVVTPADLAKMTPAAPLPPQ